MSDTVKLRFVYSLIWLFASNLILIGAVVLFCISLFINQYFAVLTFIVAIFYCIMLINTIDSIKNAIIAAINED